MWADMNLRGRSTMGKPVRRTLFAADLLSSPPASSSAAALGFLVILDIRIDQYFDGFNPGRDAAAASQRVVTGIIIPVTGTLRTT